MKKIIDLLNNDETPKPIQPSAVLLAFNWLKCDDTEEVLAGRYGIAVKTVKQSCKVTVTMIQGLYQEKIKLTVTGGEILAFSVDGVNFSTFEFAKDPSSKYYDHKSNSAGVKYEIAIAIRSPRIAWSNGPHPASVHDITVFLWRKFKSKSLGMEA